MAAGTWDDSPEEKREREARRAQGLVARALAWLGERRERRKVAEAEQRAIEEGDRHPWRDSP